MEQSRTPVTHTLKFMSQSLCDAVYNGDKSYEIRKNDRDYQVGDLIKPVSIDEACVRINHPIDNVTYIITYITTEWVGVIQDGYCVFGIKPV